ncbi:MAG: endonuclease [Pseudomonadota bacterium]
MGTEDKDARWANLLFIWGIACIGGILAGVMLLMFADVGLNGAIFLAAILTGIAGLVLQLGLTGDWLNGADTEADARPLKTAPPQAPPPAQPAPPQPAPPQAAAPAPAPAPTEPGHPGPTVTPSAPLPGQADLAGRKGEWRYEGDAPKVSSKAASKSAPAPKSAPEPAADGGDHAGGGTKPEGLSAPREGGADDLKQIKGVGPKLEQLLHSMGYFHFDQIAAWGESEVAWVDENLEGFKGRVSRDEWVAQAQTLAGGGETAFSKKVEKGDVYD